MRRLTTLVGLAAVGSAVALVASSAEVASARFVHIALAVMLLAGLASIARGSWHHRHAPVGQPHPI